MKIGFLTACIPTSPLPDLMKWAGENGFDTLEVWSGIEENADGPYVNGGFNVDAITNENAAEIVKTAGDAGIKISCLTWCVNMLDPDPATREKYSEHLKKVMDAAALLDVDVVSCFVGRDPSKDTEANLTEFELVFAPLMAHASDRGVRIAIENAPMVGWQFEGLVGNIGSSPLVWRRMFEIHPAIGLNFDPSHLVWTGVDYMKATREFADHIYHVHAKDTEIFKDVLADRGLLPPKNPRWWRHRLPGYGEVDWAAFIGLLYDVGYDGPLSIEHEDGVFMGEESNRKRGLDLGRKHLEQFVV